MKASCFSVCVLAVLVPLTIGQVPTTRSWNQATTTQPAPAVSQCACTNYSNIWLDVMVLIDSSTAMTSHGIQELSNYLVTSFLQLNIGQGEGHYTRVGLVGYGDNATLQHPLTSFTSVNDLLNRFNPTIDGTKGSNIEAAIRLAQDQFDSNGHRPNVKRVIILAASHYEPGTSEDPTQVAQQFREDGGYLITLEYVQEHGARVPILDDLASPCFVMSNSNEDLHAVDLQNKLCMANCFCLSNWEPYMINPTCRVPDGGCYYPVLIPAAEILAKAFCERQMSGMLVKVEDAAKAVFVNSMFSNTKEKTWIGLEYSPLKFGYVWDDGSNVGSYHFRATRLILRPFHCLGFNN